MFDLNILIFKIIIHLLINFYKRIMLECASITPS